MLLNKLLLKSALTRFGCAVALPGLMLAQTSQADRPAGPSIKNRERQMSSDELGKPGNFHLPKPREKYDLIVVGGTPGGIACAVRAAREGLQVLLVNPIQHLGGFVTSGAGGWEAPYDGHRSPIFSEVLSRISDFYRNKYGADSPQHRASLPHPESRKHIDRPKVEPHVAELIFEQMLAEQKTIAVLKGYYVRSVKRQARLLEAVTLAEMNGEDVIRAEAAAFVDATYEGDLIAAAGVAYQLGREPRSKYNEPHAGVIYSTERVLPPGQEGFSKDAAEGRLKLRNFHHATGPLLPTSSGEGDNSIMAYNYRLILTKDPANRVPVKKPANYDPDASKKVSNGSFIPSLPNLIPNKPNVVPNIQNGKIGWNGGRLIGPQNDFPQGDWKTRERISRLYLDTMLSLLWYYQNDPTARNEDREYWKDYGLAADEFTDNDHVPYEIYVREGRRLIGRHVFTEHDAIVAPGLGRTPIHEDSVAITDWPMDSVACLERGGEGGFADGIFFLAEESRPAQVPYRSLLPLEVDNLLAPVPLSASHVGWGCLRLEPVWIQAGEAAGFAASAAKASGTTPAEISSEKLLQKLVESRFMVSFFNDIDASSSEPWVPAVEYFGTKGFFPDYNARPHDELGAETARCWLRTFERLLAGESYSPTEEAAKLPLTGEAGISGKQFVELLVRALDKSGRNSKLSKDALVNRLGNDAPVTRAAACELLYRTLKTDSENVSTNGAIDDRIGRAAANFLRNETFASVVE